MSIIFALSGASGTGKTVTLEALRQKDHWTNSVSVTQKVLEKMQLSLDQVYKDSDLMHVFQENVKKDMSDRLQTLQNWNLGPVYIDRSHADLYGYAAHWETTNMYTNDHRWLASYELDLVGHALLIRCAFILPPGKFEHVNDGVRADAASQQPVHDAIVKFYTKHNIRYHIVQSITPEDRADEIIEISKGYL